MKSAFPAFTTDQAREARAYALEFSFSDADADYIATEATDAECVRFVCRCYAGGWRQFLADYCTAPAAAQIAFLA